MNKMNLFQYPWMALAFLCALGVFGTSRPIANPGLPQIVTTGAIKPGAFPLASAAGASPIWCDETDFEGVRIAVHNLQTDMERVTDILPDLIIAGDAKPPAEQVVIVGTLGHSRPIDALATSGKLNVDDLEGRWESFVIETIDAPAPGVKQALVIAGSDKRGAIYGIYELSEQLGVSPWCWWADVPPKKRREAHAGPGRYASGEPAVKYRGIFINDEEPCLGSWSREKFGGVNSKMYAHMFELILRLRGNYLWPAMWGKSIHEDDPESTRLANAYGVVMGTSHHEPMTRAQADWGREKNELGNGEWNYATNEEGLKRFWSEGVRRNRENETIITVGMRGDGDEPMIEGGDMEANITLLEKIIADQRQIIQKEMGVEPQDVPQLWALYKEVKNYYDHGMNIPDDITLLWCDDNWGNIRRLPTPQERKRSGGAGIYYHFDYVGTPRSYKWINTNPLPKVWEQMNMAYENGADRIWIVNVGDLKPMELPIEFFLKMAWDPRAMPKEKIGEFTRNWALREFGPAHADAIADIVSKYAKYNGWRKPELLDPGTFSVVNYLEAERVLASWREIASEAEKINASLADEYRDAFYQLVLYPAKASAIVAEMHIMAGFNRLHAAQGRVSANAEAERVRELFQQDRELAEAYHHLAGGKWNHMMAQTHIGYTSWNDPRENIMPEVFDVTPPEIKSMGVALEGSEGCWPIHKKNETGAAAVPRLPAFDSLNRQKRWIDVYRRGTKSFAFTATSGEPWVRLSASSGTVDEDQRLWVDIDWERAPLGENIAHIIVARPGGESVSIEVLSIRSSQYTPENTGAFGGLAGPAAYAAEHFARNIAVDGAQWEKIPDYGRGKSGMAVFPVTAASVTPPANSPRMEYPVFLPQAGEVHVDLMTGVSLNALPERGVRIAVSFDDQAPMVLDAFDGQSYDDPSKRADPSSPAFRNWHTWVMDNARAMQSTHHIAEPGVHTLKVWMVDPGVVLEKIVVRREDLPPSYFGPPECQ